MVLKFPSTIPPKHKERLWQTDEHPDDPLKLVIVRDMWLTGFDAQSLHTLL
ncbi:Type I restriction-modification system, restriction subunit R (EC [uncultured Gammaproteobacteria bacterium]|nr:Type I restriction-modification system, restriction subunit R (EC [uncultured Gammaproteobacteria bacterium]